MKRYKVFWCEDITENPEGEYVKYEDVKSLEDLRDTLLEGLEDLGWPVSLKDLPAYCKQLTKRIQELEEKQ